MVRSHKIGLGGQNWSVLEEIGSIDSFKTWTNLIQWIVKIGPDYRQSCKEIEFSALNDSLGCFKTFMFVDKVFLSLKT